MSADKFSEMKGEELEGTGVLLGGIGDVLDGVYGEKEGVTLFE